MKNGDATRKYILIELAKLQRKATSKDWVFIFFAGHAEADWMYDYYTNGINYRPIIPTAEIVGS